MIPKGYRLEFSKGPHGWGWALVTGRGADRLYRTVIPGVGPTKADAVRDAARWGYRKRRVFRKNPSPPRAKPAKARLRSKKVTTRSPRPTSRYYVVKAGRKLYHATVAAAYKAAQALADATGAAVAVHEAKRPTKRRAR